MSDPEKPTRHLRSVGPSEQTTSSALPELPALRPDTDPIYAQYENWYEPANHFAVANVSWSIQYLIEQQGLGDTGLPETPTRYAFPRLKPTTVEAALKPGAQWGRAAPFSIVQLTFRSALQPNMRRLVQLSLPTDLNAAEHTIGEERFDDSQNEWLSNGERRTETLVTIGQLVTAYTLFCNALKMPEPQAPIISARMSVASVQALGLPTAY